MTFNEITIWENERTRDKWDIPEDGPDFTAIRARNGKNYRINHSFHSRNVHETAELLALIENYYERLKENMTYKNPNCVVFHEILHEFQEISYGNKFEGINKPKDTIELHNPPKNWFAKHNNPYRARRRLVMLSLRNKNGSFRSWDKIKRLLLHELAHSLCNHIVYKEEGNHLDDFNDSEKYITNVSKQVSDNEIKNFIFRINKN